MLSEHQIRDLIIALAKARDWEVTYASRMASGSGDTVARLDAGVGITLRRAKVIIQRCSDLWPDGSGHAWPDSIRRPSGDAEDAA
ncbi:hypothetical protein [Roseovarius sp. MBR-6]|jgi:hypothetical protein|uniref:hypothetical protein n=1 Tax=Roseovarius sp. MBR-6 TaxID=3156459 RepID=UPI00339695AB